MFAFRFTRRLKGTCRLRDDKRTRASMCARHGLSLLVCLLPIMVQLTRAEEQAARPRRLLADMPCIATIRFGDALLSGIHQGGLPHHIFFQRCDGLWMALSYRSGQRRLQPIGTRYIPKFLARRKPFAIPDARVTVGRRNIREAWLTRPTRRYDHAVLGDDIEAGGLAVSNDQGRRIEYLLPKAEVFEDRMARLVDLDADGKDEVVVVHTYEDRGAALAVFALVGHGKDERLIRLAETRPIGKPHRWLNPAAVADFDGDGRKEIAWVETPHIGGILKIARLQGAGLKRSLSILASARGYSNHAAGSSELIQAVTFDWDGDGRSDIILPDAERHALVAVAMKDGRLKEVARIAIDGVIDSPIIAADLDHDGRGEALLVTKDGRLLSFAPVKAEDEAVDDKAR